MTRGRQIPVNSKVRRRLFSEDEPPSPTKKTTEWKGEDYFSRIIKTEFVARNLKNEVILKGMKWNFDFENEVPMDGPIKWYRKGNSAEWVRMQPSGRFLNMRKRGRNPESAIRSVYENERSKVRKLPFHTVVQRRSFFNDGRVLEYAKIQGEDDNFTNSFMSEAPPIFNIQFEHIYQNLVNPAEYHYIEHDRHWNQNLPPGVFVHPHYAPQIIDNIHNTSTPNSRSSSTADLTSINVVPDNNEASTTEDEQINDINSKNDDEMHEVEEKKEVIDYLNNVVIDEVIEANEKKIVNQESDDIKVFEMVYDKDGNENKDDSSIPEDNFENLRISENMNTNMEIQLIQNEKPSYIKENNETTPKSDDNGSVPAVKKLTKALVTSEKAKRRLFNNHF